MPVIVVANSKGGSGKTTTATLLATTAEQRGASVSLIDCDPNTPHKDWAESGSKTAIHFEFVRTEEQLDEAVEKERRSRQLVVVDLEGVASTLMPTAITMADVVLVPMGGTGLDEKQAARVVNLVRMFERRLGKKIPHRIVFTSTEAMGPNSLETDIMEKLRSAGIPMTKVQLHKRVPFAKSTGDNLTLWEMKPRKRHEKESLEKAIKNAEDFVDEVEGLIVEAIEQKKSAA